MEEANTIRNRKMSSDKVKQWTKNLGRRAGKGRAKEGENKPRRMEQANTIAKREEGTN